VLELPAGITNSQAFKGLFDLYNDDSDVLVDVEFNLGQGGEDGATGDVFYKGKAIITQLDITSPNEEDATASFSITGSGVIEAATIV
jgi:hypothetical protein